MTLFRKVFQNQSRPATGDEALDEDALREAFMVNSEDRVLPLDPFAVEDEADTAEEMSEEDGIEAQEDTVTPEDELAPDTNAEAVEPEQEVAPEVEEAEDDGADIAAVLAQTRMMEQEPVRVEPSDGPEVEMSEMPEEDDRQDVLAEAEETAEDGPVADAEAPAEEPSDVVAFAKRQLELSEHSTPR